VTDAFDANGGRRDDARLSLEAGVPSWKNITDLLTIVSAFHSHNNSVGTSFSSNAIRQIVIVRRTVNADGLEKKTRLLPKLFR